MKDNKLNIGNQWSDDELEAFVLACLKHGQDFESIRKFEGLENRNASMCRNLYSIHEEFFNNSNVRSTEKKKKLVDDFIKEHRQEFGPETPRRSTRQSSRKRKNLSSSKDEDDTEYEGKRSTRSTISKLYIMDSDEDESDETESDEDEKLPLINLNPPQLPRRGRPPKKLQSKNEKETPKPKNKSTPKSKSTSSTRKSKSTSLQSPSSQRQLFDRRKTSTPTKIPRKTKSELQLLPYDLAPLSNDSLPPTPNGSSKRGDFSRHSYLPLKLRKIGTHSTVPNIIKIQSLNRDTDEETQNRIQMKAEQFGKLLASKGRKFFACEWFYPTIDCGYFIKNEFMEELRKMHLTHIDKLTRDEWNVIRSYMGCPRRLSNKFLESERNKLHTYREIVRKFYNEAEEELPHLYIFPQQLKVGEEVIILHPETGYIHNAIITEVNGNVSYKVKLLDSPKSIEIDVPDTHVMQTGPISVNVSKRSFEAISASPDMLFSPGGDLRSLKRQRVNINGDYRSTVSDTVIRRNGEENKAENPIINGTNPISNLSLYSNSHPQLHSIPNSIENHNENSTENESNNFVNKRIDNTFDAPINGDIEPVRNSVQVNLFSQPSAGPKLDLPNDLPENVDFNSMAQTILNLERKKLLLEKISSHLNDIKNETKLTQEDKKIASLVLEIQEIDFELRPSLSSLPLSNSELDDTNLNAEDNQQITHTSFEENRKRASTLIDSLIKEIKLESGSDMGTTIEPVVNLASNCLAFLFHLQTCIQNIQYTSEDVELTLTAGLMALKPQNESRQDIFIVYEELSNIVSQIQEAILDT